MDPREEQHKLQEAVDINKFIPTTTDKTILDELYKETPIMEMLSFDDLLKLPVNEEYRKTALQFTEERFKKKLSNE